MPQSLSLSPGAQGRQKKALPLLPPLPHNLSSPGKPSPSWRERGALFSSSFLLVLVLLSLLLLFPSRASGEEQVKELHFEITGARKTREEALYRLLSLTPGKPFDPWLLQEDLRRLKGFEQFRSVTATTEVVGGEGTPGVRIRYEIEDRYATLPIFDFASGGGVFRASFGVVDRNFRGALEELGAYIGYYRSYGETLLGGVFWGDPYAGGRWDLYTTLFRDAFLHPFYTEITLPPTAILEEERWNAYAQGLYRLNRRLSLGGFLLLRHSRNQPFSGELPEPLGRFSSYTALRGGGILRLNDLIVEDFRYQGWELLAGAYEELRSGIAPAPGGFFSSRLFLLPHHGFNPALHLVLAVRKSSGVFDTLRAGALEAVRGVPDEYLQGSALAYMNLEARALFFPLWEGRLHLHCAGFLDTGAALAPRFLPALAGGGGIRIGFPYIYGLFFRGDLALLLYPRRLLAVNLGASEFF